MKKILTNGANYIPVTMKAKALPWVSVNFNTRTMYIDINVGKQTRIDPADHIDTNRNKMRIYKK